MDVLEGRDGIVGFSQIPDIEAWVLIIIIGNHELSRDLWIPHHTCLFGTLRLLLLVGVIEVGLSSAGIWLLELEDGLGRLQVPDYNLSILRGTSENVRHNSVPADCCDVGAFVEIGLSWLEFDRLFQRLTDVLDQHFSSTATQQVLLVWIELKRLDGDALMDLSGRYAPFAHQLL